MSDRRSPSNPARARVRPALAASLAAAFGALLAAAPAAAAERSAAKPAASSEGTVFEDVTAASGVRFVHRSDPEKKYILESMSGGVALFDFDADGRLDIYLVNSLTVDTAGVPETAPSALYRNLGGGKFEDVAVAAGVAHPGWGMGVCAADVDGDGRTDLYVTAVGANRLYRNLGGGRFEEVAARWGAAAGGWSTGCGFADYDRDGDLDLFVSRYVEVDLERLPVFGKDQTCQYRGIPVQCGPRGLPGTSDLLLRNDGGRFTDVTAKAGVSDPEEYFGLGIAWVDFDQDGWLDLFVANDAGPNFLYRNQKDGTFKDQAFQLGVAVSEDGGEQGCMGVAVGDPRNRGRFDLYVTNFAEEYNALYQNDGDFFSDVSFRSGSAPSSLPFVGWGTAFFDYDNDGWLDLIAVNGHVYPQLAGADLGASAAYRQRRLLYRNRGDGTFEEVAAKVAPPLLEERVSRGLAVGDLDGDGRLDVVINDLDGPAQVLRNVTPGAGRWLTVALEGDGKNRDAIGTVVTVKTGDQSQIRVVRSGTGYLSQDDLRQHFGLGTATKVDAVEVRWPDGTTTVRKDVAADGVLEIAKGR